MQRCNAMMNIWRPILEAGKRASGLLLLMLACAPVLAADRGTVVEFNETEPGMAPYKTRLIVTARYLRFDDGRDEGDFLLFDRSRHAIFNTNSIDKSILVIRDKKIELPKKKDWRHDIGSDDEKVPAIGDKPVKHMVLLTNNKVCYDLYAAKDLLPEVTTALAEYRRVLSIQHAEILIDMPGIERGVCDLANNIYLPDRHLLYGFPVRIRDHDGRGKQLAGYQENVDLKATLFKLPENYKEFSISDVRK